jgi:hypothetical protein
MKFQASSVVLPRHPWEPPLSSVPELFGQITKSVFDPCFIRGYYSSHGNRSVNSKNSDTDNAQ